MPRTWDPESAAPAEAMARLVAGNQRFVAAGGAVSTSAGQPWSESLATSAQRPFAVIVGCSDSRMPVEIVFDQGFGDLFVARIIGNVCAPSVIASVEFAAAQLGTRLVVVMGHTRCGAVTAAVNTIASGAGPDSVHIRSITDRITPHIEGLVRPGSAADNAVVREAVHANVRASADQLRHGSRQLEDLVIAGRVAVLGAVYELETGAVHFLDRPPGE